MASYINSMLEKISVKNGKLKKKAKNKLWRKPRGRLVWALISKKTHIIIVSVLFENTTHQFTPFSISIQ